LEYLNDLGERLKLRITTSARPANHGYREYENVPMKPGIPSLSAGAFDQFIARRQCVCDISGKTK
jgi:hypothetical protein